MIWYGWFWGGGCLVLWFDGKVGVVCFVEEQQVWILVVVVVLRLICVVIVEVQGLMCVEEVVIECLMFGFDQVVIDGYVVCSVDVVGVGDIGGV